MKPINFIVSAFLTVALIIFSASCKKEVPLTNEQKVEAALDAFVAKLVADPPTAANISDRVKDYLVTNATFFFGSTVTLLDAQGVATFSPYWYRANNSVAVKNLAEASYHINDQLWLRKPIDEGKSIWTDPYFDTGGGNIQMKSRVVPVFINGKIIAVATTDLAL